MKIIIGTMVLSVIGTASFSGITDSTRVINPQMTVKCDVNGTYIVSYPGTKQPQMLRLLNLPCRGLSEKQAKDFIEPINLIYIPEEVDALEVEINPDVKPKNRSYTWDRTRLLLKVRYDQVADQIEFKAIKITGELQLHVYDDRGQLLYHDNALTGSVDQIFDFVEIKTNWVNFVLSSGGQDISRRIFHLRRKLNL